MPASNEKRGRGRPLHGQHPKTAPLPCRTELRLRQRLDDAARRNDRSLAQEIEARLYFSFDAEDDDRLRGIAQAALGQGTGQDNEKGSDDGDRN